MFVAFDATLGSRVNEASRKWYAEVETIFQAALAESGFEDARAKAAAKIEELVMKLRDRESALNSMVDELPPIEVPEIDLGEPPDPLVSTQRLKTPLSCAGQRRGSVEVKIQKEK
jgi:hypothetical protein